MIKKLFCVLLLAVGFSMRGVADDNKVPGFQIKNDPLVLNTHDRGNITFEYGGTSLLSSIFLGVHWDFSQCNEGQVKELAGSQAEGEVKIKGKVANAAFYESIKKVEKGFEVSYDISLDADNPFSISRHWELYPWFSDEHLERMKDCNYTFEDAAGIHKGALKDLIQSSQTVKSFTIHNYLSRDIRMEFPGGAALVERRTEKPSSGIWFFVHAVNENGEDFVYKSGFNAITISVSSECENQWERDNQIYNPDKLQEVLDAFWKQSVKVMIMNSAVRSDKNIMPGMSLQELVNRFKTHPAILCWYISDEPYSQAEIKKAWDRAEMVRAADPYHPTLINLVPEAFGDGRLADPATGKSPMDIFSLTYYPVGCKLTKPRDKNLKYGDMIFEKLGNIARSENKVVMHASQAYGYGTDHWEREPTPQEAEYLIYMPLIFGNRGYMWFGGRPKCRALWEKIIQSNSEMDLLTPVLCDEKISGDDVFKSLSGKAFGIMRKHKGEYWFISTSKSENTAAETFEFNNLVPAEFNNAEVEVMFENRKLKLKNGVLSDSFPSYGRHVYRIANKK
ncbi:MAG: hypothetical protein WCP55_04225 [Lentisphaerota bacterium]